MPARAAEHVMFLQELETIDINNVENFEEQFARDGRPVLIRNAAESWPAMDSLQFAALKEQFGQLQVPVRESDDEFVTFFGPKSNCIGTSRKLDLATYIDSIQSESMAQSRPNYAGNISLFEDPELALKLRSILTDCHFPDWLRRRGKQEVRLWIGAAGQRSTIHNDPYHNFNAQIVGTKSFLIFAPTEHANLYPVFLHSGCWASPVDPAQPCLEMYPNFRSLSGYHCA